MSEPRKNVPITELPIRVFKEVGGAGAYASIIEAGPYRMTFFAAGALDAKRKAKAWAQEQHDRLQGKKKPEAK